MEFKQEIYHIAWKDERTQSYHVDENNVKEFIQTNIQELMPKIVDVIVDESEIVALCEDGSVWSWGKGKDKSTATKIQNLNDVKKNCICRFCYVCII